MNDPLPLSVQPTRRRGCLFYGCLTLLIVSLLAALGIFLAVRYAARQITAVVMQYTDAAPAPMPKVEISDADYAALEKRVEAFGDAIKSGRPGEPLRLSATDINALIARSTNMAVWRDKLSVSLDGNQVRGQVSLPLSELGNVPLLGSLRDRYLNGGASFNVGMVNGQLFVSLQSLEVKGQTAPKEFLTSLAQKNLAEDAARDPKNAEVLSRLQNVTVEGGEMVVTPKSAQ
jgi:hypothetical protein